MNNCKNDYKIAIKQLSMLIKVKNALSGKVIDMNLLLY